MARKIADVLLPLFVLGITGFLFLVLVDLRDRYDQKITAPDSKRIDGRNLGLMPGLPTHPSAGAEHARRAAGRSGELAPPEVLQEPAKPVSTHATGNANQGMSVALSADGSTAIVGGPGPNNVDRDRSSSIGPAGAAWIFIHRGGVWAQQGGKLIGTTNAPGGGLWSQGAAVALSADGNTAIVGGPSDNRTTGAVWVFVRSGSVWEQQGDKLVGTGAHRVSESGIPLGQGMSVALSADGDTAIAGGWRSEGAWVFTRSRGIWSQQGKQLVGSGAIGMARQGASVALSADGNTAMVGAGLTTTGPARYGCSPAALVSGRSKARSSSARVLWEPPAKARRSRCPPTATPPSSVARVTVRGIDRCPLVSDRRAQHGYSSATGGSGRSKARSSSAAALWEPPSKACPSPYPLTVTSRL